jgi:hypothetical protein
MENVYNRRDEEITAAIQKLWIYQNKGMTQARKEAFSQFPPADVAAYLQRERIANSHDGDRTDAGGTY